MEDEEDDRPFESEREKWNREHDTGQSCGTCSICGSKIYQTTYTDFCKCGANDESY